MRFDRPISWSLRYPLQSDPHVLMRKVDPDFDRMLVAYVEQHPCLYDRNHEHYKLREKTQKAWEAVADRLETTAEEAETRWRSLKKGFTKIQRQCTPEVSVCKSSLKKNCVAFPFFESMLWLVPYLKNNERTCSMKKQIKCPVHGTLDSLTERMLKSQIVENPMDGNASLNSSISSESSFFPKPSPSSTGKKTLNIKSVIDEKSTQTDDDAKDDQKTNLFSKHASYPQCSSSLNADVNFMIAVISDMQMISPRRKIKFKREVFELLEKNIVDGKS